MAALEAVDVYRFLASGWSAETHAADSDAPGALPLLTFGEPASAKRQVALGARMALVISGAVTQRLTIGDRRSVEILGARDVLHLRSPADRITVNWHAHEATRIAILDDRAVTELSARADGTSALLASAADRIDSMRARMAMYQERRLETRLRQLMSHIAERWGRVTLRGTAIPLVLTHELLAELSGARRPSVTRALGVLDRAGTLINGGSAGWLLREGQETRD